MTKDTNTRRAVVFWIAAFGGMTLSGFIVSLLLWRRGAPGRRESINVASTYFVTDRCINCTAEDCVEVCPVDAFRRGPDRLVIDPDSCIGCGSCAEECPVVAISMINAENFFNPGVKFNAVQSKKWPEITEKSIAVGE